MINFNHLIPGKGQGKFKVPFRHEGADTGGTKVLSGISFVGQTATMLALKTAGPSKERDNFIERSAKFLASSARAQGWSSGFVIVYPKSSSKIVPDFAEQVTKQFNGVQNLGPVFRKGQRHEIEIKDHPGVTDSVRKSLTSAVDRMFRLHGGFQSKKGFKPHMKFLSGTMIYSGSKNLQG